MNLKLKCFWISRSWNLKELAKTPLHLFGSNGPKKKKINRRGCLYVLNLSWFEMDTWGAWWSFILKFFSLFFVFFVFWDCNLKIWYDPWYLLFGSAYGLNTVTEFSLYSLEESCGHVCAMLEFWISFLWCHGIMPTPMRRCIFHWFDEE